MRTPITIVAMSDMHGYLDKPNRLPKGDVYCICGDIMPLDIQRDEVSSIAWLCTKFFPWVEQLPCDRVMLVAGNHDFIFQRLATDRNGNHRKPKRVLQKLMAPKKLVLLEDSECIYNGYRFYGSPWCPELTNWAYYADSPTLINKFKKIPEHTDVLITHCPPALEDYGTVLQSGWNCGHSYGCTELRDSIYQLEVRPKLHIFGHVHSGQHMSKEILGTIYANVSIKDEGYLPIYEPNIFELS
jgi:Icc-related predicted phosphoesterase